MNPFAKDTVVKIPLTILEAVINFCTYSNVRNAAMAPVFCNKYFQFKRRKAFSYFEINLFANPDFIPYFKNICLVALKIHFLRNFILIL